MVPIDEALTCLPLGKLKAIIVFTKPCMSIFIARSYLGSSGFLEIVEMMFPITIGKSRQPLSRKRRFAAPQMNPVRPSPFFGSVIPRSVFEICEDHSAQPAFSPYMLAWFGDAHWRRILDGF